MVGCGRVPWIWRTEVKALALHMHLPLPCVPPTHSSRTDHTCIRQWHAVHKTPEELRELKRRISAASSLKGLRRARQEANVAAKAVARDAHKQRCLDGQQRVGQGQDGAAKDEGPLSDDDQDAAGDAAKTDADADAEDEAESAREMPDEPGDEDGAYSAGEDNDDDDDDDDDDEVVVQAPSRAAAAAPSRQAQPSRALKRKSAAEEYGDADEDEDEAVAGDDEDMSGTAGKAVDDDIDDAEWYRREVGQEPDPGLSRSTA